MTFSHGLGMLATIEQGTPRLRPLEFTQFEGEWWASAPRSMQHSLALCDGQHVEILLINEEANDSRVRGVLECSGDPADLQHLSELQQSYPSPRLHSVEDANLVVVKVIPEGSSEQ